MSDVPPSWRAYRTFLSILHHTQINKHLLSVPLCSQGLWATRQWVSIKSSMSLKGESQYKAMCALMEECFLCAVKEGFPGEGAFRLDRKGR